MFAGATLCVCTDTGVTLWFAQRPELLFSCTDPGVMHFVCTDTGVTLCVCTDTGVTLFVFTGTGVKLFVCTDTGVTLFLHRLGSYSDYRGI